MTNDPSLYARSFADVYDDWYADLDDPQTHVDALSVRCGSRSLVLELGSGTGRLALPLAEAGFDVLALDASPQMLHSAAPGPQPIAADMAALPFDAGLADVVLIAYNTFFNLATPVLQQRCLAECSRVLRPGGRLVIEAFIAARSDGGFGVSTRAHPTESGAKLMIITGPDEANDDLIVGSHIELGRSITCRPWRLCYQDPTQLDQLAAAAGLRLAERFGDWAGVMFDADGLRHVSWYERS